MNQAQHMLYHGTIVPLQKALAEVELEIEDLRANLREANEEGGSTWVFCELLSHAYGARRDLLIDLEFAEERFEDYARV